MSQPAATPQTNPSESTNWASSSRDMRVGQTPEGALNINVEGRTGQSPLQGFGQLWQKTYRVRLEGVDRNPADVMAHWKAEFPRFQPPENHFYPSMEGVKPGEVMLIDSTLPVFPGLPGIIPIASGVMILYADDESFTVMTPEGFPVAGWNTFSTYEDEDGCTVAQVKSLERASDPIYEFGNRFMGGAGQQEKIWRHVLESLASDLGVTTDATTVIECLDEKVQWSEWKNIFHNAMFRTMLYVIATPIRWLRPKK